MNLYNLIIAFEIPINLVLAITVRSIFVTRILFIRPTKNTNEIENLYIRAYHINRTNQYSVCWYQGLTRHAPEKHKFDCFASGNGKIGNTPYRHNYSGAETLGALSFLCIQLDETDLCGNNAIYVYNKLDVNTNN